MIEHLVCFKFNQFISQEKEVELLERVQKVPKNVAMAPFATSCGEKMSLPLVVCWRKVLPYENRSPQDF